MDYEGIGDEELEGEKRRMDAQVVVLREAMRDITEEQERRHEAAEAERLAAKAVEEDAARERGEYVAPTQHVG